MTAAGGSRATPPDAPVHGYEVLAASLLDHHDGPIFGLLGDANLSVVAEAVRRGARFVPARHEGAGISMAAGYSLVGRLPAFVTTTRGPGVANAVTALTSAVRDRAPLVYLAGDSPLAGPMNNQVIDQEALLAPTGARVRRVEDGTRLSAAVAAAFAEAARERIPVVLDIPSDLLLGASLPQADGDEAVGPASIAVPLPSDALLAEAAARLLAARHPVILAGRGATAPEVANRLRRLADLTGALLATTLPAHGLFAGDAFDVGYAGGFMIPALRELLGAADVVLVVGASLNRYTTAEETLFADATLLRVDTDPSVVARTRVGRSARLLEGDAGSTIAGLLHAVETAPPREDPGARTAEAATRIEAARHASHVPVRHGPLGVDPYEALRVVDALLPADRRVVVDVGHFSVFPCQVLPVTGPGQLLPAFGFASVGLGLGTAIGAALADPSRPVLLVIGDGGLLMAPGDLETLARTRADVTVAVMNDAAYGAEVHHLRQRGQGDAVARFPRTDFAALARAFGIAAASVDTPADLEVLTGRNDVPGWAVGGQRGPRLIDVRINPEVVSDRFALLGRSAGS